MIQVVGNRKSKLTPRMEEIKKLIEDGFTNVKIAEQLNVSVSDIEKLRAKIRERIRRNEMYNRMSRASLNRKIITQE